MKTNLKTLEDALVYQLQGLLYIERKVRDEFSDCSSRLTSDEVRSAIEKYMETTDDKLLKLNRVFNYLLREPVARKNRIARGMLKETHLLLDHTNHNQLRDLLIVSCVQAINAYKVTSYKTAYRFALALELETPAELLSEILRWELSTKEVLASLSAEEFNRSTKVLI